MREEKHLLTQKEWLQKLTPFSVVRPYLAELLLISLMINLLSLVLPLVLLQIYDRIIRFSAISTLQWLLVGVFSALLLESLLRFGRSLITGWIGSRFEYQASCTAMQHLLHLPWSRFAQSSVAVQSERLAAVLTLKEFYSGQAALVLLELPFVLLYLLLIHHLAGGLVWVPVCLLLLYALAAWYWQSSLYRKIQESEKYNERRLHFIIETLSAISIVKALALEFSMARRHEQLLTDAAAQVQEIGLHGADAQNTGFFFSQLATIAMVSMGGMQVIEQQLTVGGLVACSMLAGRALQPLQTAVGIWARFQSIRIARNRLEELFAQGLQGEEEGPTGTALQGEERGVAAQEEPLCREQSATLSFRQQKNSPQGASLCLQQVTFPVDGQQPVLRNLSLQVVAGETIAIIGANGSGKTLLLSLIMGIFAPGSGIVRVDALDPYQHRPDGITYIPQEGVLLRGTLLENLHMFREEWSESAKQAARLLGVEEFILALPKGYDTLIDDGNQEMIPRGIKQRLVIARALVTPPRLLLFDEANMAIDGNGDERVRQALLALRDQCTLILISQRPSLLSLAHRVLTLRDGCLWPVKDNSATTGG
ncbi:peptidase domain-containing ABC transporter [Candidatus Magnetaquicoccus inordinatus]|uniref:peptidase domain-containing ABC transporter n=1 Tax=Candidatus Magnetaquicoccus inordinatus TaxID=2496818 RepID=UPI00102B4BB9|nr:ATP-binding cassette domain-containing protein [Candidatus Magnetaquicoccus inordinatus]